MFLSKLPTRWRRKCNKMHRRCTRDHCNARRRRMRKKHIDCNTRTIDNVDIIKRLFDAIGKGEWDVWILSFSLVISFWKTAQKRELFSYGQINYALTGRNVSLTHNKKKKNTLKMIALMNGTYKNPIKWWKSICSRKSATLT